MVRESLTGNSQRPSNSFRRRKGRHRDNASRCTHPYVRTECEMVQQDSKGLASLHVKQLAGRWSSRIFLAVFNFRSRPRGSPAAAPVHRRLMSCFDLV